MIWAAQQRGEYKSRKRCMGDVGATSSTLSSGHAAALLRGS